MKRLFTFLFVLLTVVTLATTTAYATETTVPADEIWEYSVYQGHDAIITAYKGDAETVVIPDTVDGLRVIGIGDNVFKNQYNLKSITFPDTLTSIGEQAFYGCVKLESLILPEKLTSIGNQAFTYCKALSKIVVNSASIKDFYDNYLGIIGQTPYNNTFYEAGIDSPNGIVVEFTNTVARIPAYMFGCSDSGYARIAHVTVGENVQHIGDGAFYRCYDLKDVTFEGNSDLRSIGSDAFRNCINVGSFYLPKKLEIIDSGAFVDCKRLSQITVDSEKLKDCSQYYSTFANIGAELDDGVVIEFTGSVTRIPAYMFAVDNSDNYARIKEVTIGSNVQSIGLKSFIGCYDMQTVILSENSDLRTIGSNAFGGCTSLTSFTFPDKLESVGREVFYNCKKLENITVSSKKVTFDDSGYTFSNAGKETPNGITVKFTDNVESISAYMFYSEDSENYARVKSVDIGMSVTNVGDYAFGACTDLKEITFNGSAPAIGKNAFHSVAATAYYPASKNWPSSVLSNYGGNITWVPVGSVVIVGTYTTDFVMPAADLGVTAPDAVLRATLAFSEDGKASIDWEAVDLTAFKLFFHEMFVSAYCTMAYAAGITEYQQMDQFCIESTGLSISDYMDTIVTDEAMKASFTPPSAIGTYSYNDGHTAIFTDLAIMGVPSNPAVENSFVLGDGTLYLNAASYGKPDYTFVCKK